MNLVDHHNHYMSLALQLAERGRYTVSPNPMVGCVLVKDNQMIGSGFHEYAGGPHAEIRALNAAHGHIQDATAYITLEPCCHHGRTPPCTEALIQAGIKKVVIACADPNPLVMGKGIKALQAANIEVELGIKETEAKNLNEIFFHYIQTKRPFVIAKWAMSLDGKTITHANDEKTISCKESLVFSHQTRLQVDAILVGAKTAIEDDPLLTARYVQVENATQPLRIIVSSHGHLPTHLKLFSSEAKTLVATTHINDTWYRMMQEKKVEVLLLPKDKNEQVDLHALLIELGKKEITSILVEGGMTMHQRFFSANLVNKIHVYLSPVIIGSMEKKQFTSHLTCTPLGSDFHFTASYTEEPYV